MGEQYLTMAEIEAKYPKEWVLIDRPTNNRRTGDVTGGYVIMHTPDRAAINQRLLSLRDGRPFVFALLHIGLSAEEEAMKAEMAGESSRL